MSERGRDTGGRFAPRVEEPHNTPNLTTSGAPPPDPGRGGTAGAKVTVACKLPHGLLLQVCHPVTRMVPVMGGGMREETTWERRPEMVFVRGYAVPYGVVPSWPIVGGYGLTHNVDKEFWDKYLEQNQASPWIVNKLLFAYESAAKASDEASANAGRKSGLEPLDPNNLPRGLGARTPGGGIVGQIETATTGER